MPVLRLRSIEIVNFRGIERLRYPQILDGHATGFSNLNLVIGPNGHGKSSLVAAVAHALAAIRRLVSKEEGAPIFRDADFRFTSLDRAEPLSIGVGFELTNGNAFQVSLLAERSPQGAHRSWINGQEPCKVTITPPSLAPELIRALKLVELTASGSRICPILESTTPGHAATTQQDDRGFLDQFRARMVEVLSKSEVGEEVKSRVPRLAERVLDLVNTFLGEIRFSKFHLGFGKSLVIECRNGTFASWDTLSGGEKQMFHFAHLLVERPAGRNGFYFIEEPENQVHPGLQREFLRRFQELAAEAQVFIVTQSSSYLELDNHDSVPTRHLLCVRESDHTELVDLTDGPVSRLLPRLGITGRTVGQARSLLLVEGPSDALFFGAVLKVLFSLDGIKAKLSDLLDICHLAPPKVITATAIINKDAHSGWQLADRSKAIKLNLYRPGATHYFVLFDPDVSSSLEAQEFGISMRSALGGEATGVTVIDPWYRTLESLYDSELWAVAHPRHLEHKRNRKWTSARHWELPIDNLSWGFTSCPTEGTLKQTKFRSAESIVRWRGFRKWVKANRAKFEALDAVVQHTKTSFLSRQGN